MSHEPGAGGSPEDFCNRCGSPNVSWSAPSPLWNAVMRSGSIDGPQEYGEIVCPTCFCVLARERGVATDFRVDGDALVPLELVTPSGRAWDARARLWVEAGAAGWVWHASYDWDSASESSVRDARTVTRGKARADFAHGECSIVEAGAWKRYARGLDRQEKYEWWVESQDGGWDEHPDTPPEGWEGWMDEDVPAWTFCPREHAAAIPVWVCGLLVDGPPPSQT